MWLTSFIIPVAWGFVPASGSATAGIGYSANPWHPSNIAIQTAAAGGDSTPIECGFYHKTVDICNGEVKARHLNVELSPAYGAVEGGEFEYVIVAEADENVCLDKKEDLETIDQWNRGYNRVGIWSPMIDTFGYNYFPIEPVINASEPHGYRYQDFAWTKGIKANNPLAKQCDLTPVCSPMALAKCNEMPNCKADMLNCVIFLGHDFHNTEQKCANQCRHLEAPMQAKCEKVKTTKGKQLCQQTHADILSFCKVYPFEGQNCDNMAAICGRLHAMYDKVICSMKDFGEYGFDRACNRLSDRFLEDCSASWKEMRYGLHQEIAGSNTTEDKEDRQTAKDIAANRQRVPLDPSQLGEGTRKSPLKAPVGAGPSFWTHGIDYDIPGRPLQPHVGVKASISGLPQSGEAA